MRPSPAAASPSKSMGPNRVELGYAEIVAAKVLADLYPWCEKIVVAGSIRRRAPLVKDIEVLCVPRQTQVDMFGEPTGEDDMSIHLKGHIDYRMRFNKNGGVSYGLKNKLMLHRPTGVPVDVFSTPAENWGMALVVRTGPADFNIRLMKRFKDLGMAGHAYGGVTLRDGTDVVVPTEAAVFELAEWEYVEPEDRW